MSRTHLLLAIGLLTTAIVPFDRHRPESTRVEVAPARRPLRPLTHEILPSRPIEIAVPIAWKESNCRVFPAVGDLDGDGRFDLLVGGGRGRLQVHRNVGTNARPSFAPPTWFDEDCPDGRIPEG